MVDKNEPIKPITTIDDKDFEFDCPQFTDLSAINPLSEEYCQEFFDKKTEEIKRNSNEFALEIDKNTIDKNKTDDDNNKNKMDMDMSDDDESDDENISNKPISNLLSATEFNKSNLSNGSNKRKSNESGISSHLYSMHTNKINKNRHQLSSEEIMLKNLEQQKLEIEKLKEKNAKNVAKMRDDHNVFHPVRSTKLTIPITPALHTTRRAKKRLNKNKDKEKENNNGQFHARKFNPKIFKQNASNLGILNNVKNKMTTTTVQPFNFMTEKRAQKHQNQMNQKNHR